MAERKPRARTTRASARKPKPAAETPAQAEFARYKSRVGEAGEGPAAPFATPLPPGAVPVWSLQPPMVATGPPVPGPYAWGPGAPGAGDVPSLTEGVGTTIRLGVGVLNAALANSLRMLSGVEAAVGALAWRDHECGCGGHDCCGIDCCAVLGCGCGSCCCEPSVGSCC